MWWQVWVSFTMFLVATARFTATTRAFFASTAATAVVSAQRTMFTSTSTNLLTWNIAAINNNPFEYWIDHPDPRYQQLMSGVQSFMSDKSKDVEIEQVFSEEKYQDLIQFMRKDMHVSPTVLDEVSTTRWQPLKKKSIISGFLKDQEIGKKRFASMPDRLTNTMEGGHFRPTPINCFPGTFVTFEDWWSQWKSFVFNAKVFGKIKPIPKAKYPALTEDDERLSVPLQIISLAIFDSILVHMLSSISGMRYWQELRHELCSALNSGKNKKILDILSTKYASTADVMFLQEAGVEFSKLLKSTFSHKYWVMTNPEPTREQNSVVLISRHLSPATPTLISVDGFTDVENGDLILVKFDNILFASFHGDTDGLCTLSVLRQVSDLAKREQLLLVFGMDANTYDRPKAGQQLDVREFNRVFKEELELTSCFGSVVDTKNFTTFNARTFLQPQLNKAAGGREEFLAKGDVNPKDFILAPSGLGVFASTLKDNTGDRKFVENMVFPTLTFPSDHAIVTSTFIPHLARQCDDIRTNL